MEKIKTAHRTELELIQDKVQTALNKKKDIIQQLYEEIKMKDTQIVKLKEMLEKQRRELLAGV